MLLHLWSWFPWCIISIGFDLHLLSQWHHGIDSPDDCRGELSHVSRRGLMISRWGNPCGHRTGRAEYIIYFLFITRLWNASSEMISDTHFHNITALTFLDRLLTAWLDRKNASSSSRSRAALFHVTSTLISAATDCHLHVCAPVTGWEVVCIWGRDRSTSGPVCLNRPPRYSQFRSVVIAANYNSV